MKKVNSKLNYITAAMLAVIICFTLCAVIFSVGGKAYAVSANKYSNVVDDLHKDDSFTMLDYPVNNHDYSLQVIQIAESINGEVLVYVYQPCGQTKQLVATSINISTSINDNLKYVNYDLTLLNSSDVFYKYKVDGMAVKSTSIRYYDISAIYRAWDKDIDGNSGNDNIKNEKHFNVGKLFKAETIDGDIKYSCKKVDTIEIINPFVDFISYGQQSGWDYIFGVTNWTDIHYIAFSTDKKIDTLKEADVTYATQSYHYTDRNGEGYTYGDKSKRQYLTLTGKEKIGIDGYKLYTWNSIYRTEDFVKTVNLTGKAKTEVEKSEFVLVFLKTSFKEQELWSPMQGHYKEADGTKVSDVSILRLIFETDGITYNLGALIDKQEGDDNAGNKPDPGESIGFWAYIWRCIVRLFDGTATLVEQIIAVVVIAIAVLFLPALLTVLSLVFPAFRAVMKIIFNGLWTGIKYLFIGLWYIISAPFRFIAWIVGKIRGIAK